MMTHFSPPDPSAEDPPGSPGTYNRAGVARPRTRRIPGVDFARGLALLGMMAVHIMPLSVLVDGSGIAPTWAGAMFSGRASALFVVMAGVGLALLSGGARGVAPGALPLLRRSVVIRAVLITLIGYAAGSLDSGVAVILVHYGLLFLAAVPFLKMRLRFLAVWTVAWMLLSPLVYYALRRGLGGDLEDFQVGTSPRFWDLATPAVYITDLLVTGDYPLLVWFGYLLTGLCVGRLAFGRVPVALGLLAGGTLVAAGSKLLSAWLLGLDGARAALREAADVNANELAVGLVTGGNLDIATDTGWFLAIAAPHTSAPLDAWHVVGCAVAVLGASQLLCMGIIALLGQAGETMLWPVTGAGAATLTLYVGHLVALDYLGDATDAVPTTVLFVYYALSAMLAGLVLKYFDRRGPLEAAVHWTSTTMAREL